MKKNCVICKIMYEDINFCPTCGKRLIDDDTNTKIERNKIDETFRMFSDKSNKVISEINSELASSQTVQKAKKATKNFIDGLIVIFGVFAILILIFQIVHHQLTDEPTVLQQVIRPNPNLDDYTNNYYYSSLDVKIGILFPGIILPCIFIILAMFKKPVFLFSLFLLFFLT